MHISFSWSAYLILTEPKVHKSFQKVSHYRHFKEKQRCRVKPSNLPSNFKFRRPQKILEKYAKSHGNGVSVLAANSTYSMPIRMGKKSIHLYLTIKTLSITIKTYACKSPLNWDYLQTTKHILVFLVHVLCGP